MPTSFYMLKQFTKKKKKKLGLKRYLLQVYFRMRKQFCFKGKAW